MALILVLWLALYSGPDFAHDVAARCKGESSFAISECACTVRNRLEAGWSEAHVLDAYYAPDVAPTLAEVALAQRVLDGDEPCAEDLYFMFSRADTYYLGIEDLAPVLVVRDGAQEIRFFEQWYRGRLD